MFAGAKDIPAFVWALVLGFGIAYLILMLLAQSVAPPTADADSWDGA